MASQSESRPPWHSNIKALIERPAIFLLLCGVASVLAYSLMQDSKVSAANAAARLHEEYKTQRELQSLIQKKSVILEKLATQRENASKTRIKEPLIELVTETSKRFDIDINDITADDDQHLSLTIKSATFRDAILWLYELEGSSEVRIGKLSMAKTDSTGFVSIRAKIRQ